MIKTSGLLATEFHKAAGLRLDIAIAFRVEEKLKLYLRGGVNMR